MVVTPTGPAETAIVTCIPCVIDAGSLGVVDGVGHARTSQVVSFAGELLKKAEDLLHTGLHTSEIVTGYKAAFDKTLEMLPTLAIHKVRRRVTRGSAEGRGWLIPPGASCGGLQVQDVRNKEEVASALQSVLATKYFGYQVRACEVDPMCTTTSHAHEAPLTRVGLSLCHERLVISYLPCLGPHRTCWALTWPRRLCR
jgi:hypothetical protein